MHNLDLKPPNPTFPPPPLPRFGASKAEGSGQRPHAVLIACCQAEAPCYCVLRGYCMCIFMFAYTNQAKTPIKVLWGKTAVAMPCACTSFNISACYCCSAYGIAAVATSVRVSSLLPRVQRCCCCYQPCTPHRAEARSVNSSKAPVACLLLQAECGRRVRGAGS